MIDNDKKIINELYRNKYCSKSNRKRKTISDIWSITSSINKDHERVKKELKRLSNTGYSVKTRYCDMSIDGKLSNIKCNFYITNTEKELANISRKSIRNQYKNLLKKAIDNQIKGLKEILNSLEEI